jgi:hypothetical protein
MGSDHDSRPAIFLFPKNVFYAQWTFVVLRWEGGGAGGIETRLTISCTPLLRWVEGGWNGVCGLGKVWSVWISEEMRRGKGRIRLRSREKTNEMLFVRASSREKMRYSVKLFHCSMPLPFYKTPTL